MAVGDFNRDSDPDLAVAYEDESVDAYGGVSMLLGDSGTNFRRTETDYAAGYKPNSVAVGDFDGDSDSDLAVGSGFRTPHIEVLLANSAPTTAGDAYTPGQDTPLDVGAPGVLGNDKDPDGDTLTVALASAPAHGSVTLNADGSFRYTPDTGGSGSDSFSLHGLGRPRRLERGHGVAHGQGSGVSGPEPALDQGRLRAALSSFWSLQSVTGFESEGEET